MNVHIIFYSMYGHVWKMAEAIAEGVSAVPEAKVSLWQVPELLSNEQLEATGAQEARKYFAHIPDATPGQLEQADVIFFGAPTRYGMIAAQMKNFIDQTGSLWVRGLLIGKLASVFGSTNSQHCGHEANLISMHTVLLGLGMVIAGVPPSAPGLHQHEEVCGGTPYGAATIAGRDGSRQPSSAELEIARIQGKHVATLGRKLFA